MADLVYELKHSILFSRERSQKVEPQWRCSPWSKIESDGDQNIPRYCQRIKHKLSTLTSSISHFPHTTYLWQMTLKTYLNNNMDNLPKWRHAYWIELKTLCQKEKLLVLSKFFFCHKVFKSCLLQRHQSESVCMWERVNIVVKSKNPCFKMMFYTEVASDRRINSHYINRLFFLATLWRKKYNKKYESYNHLVCNRMKSILCTDTVGFSLTFARTQGHYISCNEVSLLQKINDFENI